MPSARTSLPLAARGARRLDHRHPDHPRLQGWYHASRIHLPDILWSDFFLAYFVEDEGNVVFYQDAHGRAACMAVYPEGVVSDSGTAFDERHFGFRTPVSET